MYIRKVKKISSIFLSLYLFVGSMIPGNSFFELSELPALLQHYQYHRMVETPGISFYDFLGLHYGNPKHEKSDPENHCKLPMHHRVTSAPADEIVYVGENDKTPSCLNELALVSSSELNLATPFTHTGSIFHPPKA
jgi:hypothetical protein